MKNMANMRKKKKFNNVMADALKLERMNNLKTVWTSGMINVRLMKTDESGQYG